MPVFLLFEMFYFQQFLTYQECHIFTIHPAKSSTLWWNQQYEQVLNIGEICSLLYLSIIVLYFILFSLLCGILVYGEYGYTLYEIIKYSLGYNIILCRYTLFSVEFSSFAIKTANGWQTNLERIKLSLSREISSKDDKSMSKSLARALTVSAMSWKQKAAQFHRSILTPSF